MKKLIPICSILLLCALTVARSQISNFTQAHFVPFWENDPLGVSGLVLTDNQIMDLQGEWVLEKIDAGDITKELDPGDKQKFIESAGNDLHVGSSSLIFKDGNFSLTDHRGKTDNGTWSVWQGKIILDFKVGNEDKIRDFYIKSFTPESLVLILPREGLKSPMYHELTFKK
jgi:hypothetical protein